MEEMSIHEIQAKMAIGEITSASLVETYLLRVKEIDQNGPTLDSIIETNPDALEIASQLDQERADKGPRSLLHGIPILVKDNIDTGDKMVTAAGSLALANSHAKQDAFIVERLRQAGAVIFGKANLSEWANFRSARSSSGWSSRGGQCRNPYAMDRTPCGSSSGSGAAVAANLCTASIGTETDGSIVCPSSVNGIVGIKPTLGLLSRSGIIPIGHSQDTPGPMARSVADAAILLGAMAGVDPRDPATQASQGKAHADYTPFLDLKGLQGARIGVARNYFGFDPAVDAIIEASLLALKELGAQLVDPANITTEEKLGETEFAALLYEFKADLNAYLNNLSPEVTVRSLEELIAFNLANAETVMPYFGQDRFVQAQEKGPLTDETYLKALETNRRLSQDEGIDAVMREHKLDALVAPTSGPAWLIDWVNGDRYSGWGCSSAPAVAGYPHITVPAGYVFGLPVGISFFAGAYQEAQLIRYAYAFEQATQVRKAPQYLPTVRFEG